MVLLVPILNRLGHKLSLKELFILSYAGLRGALGLSLALTVNADREGFSQRTRELILFYVAGVTGLSLLINGTTTQLIVNKIKMIKTFPAKEKIFRAMVREIDDASCENYEKLRDENPAAICDWEAIKKITGLNPSNLQESISLKEASNIFLTGPKRQESYMVRVNEDDLRSEARCRLLQIVNTLIWERYEQGELEAYGANILSRAVKVSLDYLNTKINIFEFLYMYFMKPSSLSLLTKLAKVPVAGKYFKNTIVNHMVFIYDVTTSLVEIIDELRPCIEKIPLQEFIVDGVYNEFKSSKKEATSYLNKLEDQFLEVIKYVTTKRYITKILMSQKRLITERYNTGAMEAKEYQSLMSEMEKKLRGVSTLLKVKWESPTFSNLITSYPIFSILSKPQIDKIVATSEKVKFKKGESLFEEGKSFNGIYLITRGEVDITYNLESRKKGVGHLVLFFNLVMNDNISRINCVADQDIETQRLNINTLRQVMQENKEFEEKVYKRAFPYLRFMQSEKATELTKMSDASIKALTRTARVVNFSKGDALKLAGGAFLIKGIIKRNDIIYNEYYYIPRNKKIAIAHSSGLMLTFDSELHFIRRESSSPSKLFLFSKLESAEMSVM